MIQVRVGLSAPVAVEVGQAEIRLEQRPTGEAVGGRDRLAQCVDRLVEVCGGPAVLIALAVRDTGDGQPARTLRCVAGRDRDGAAAHVDTAVEIVAVTGDLVSEKVRRGQVVQPA
ncbi:hypothetical protein [Streptomyces malaysiensis]|uniref:hypothetical protein n=1 Tax=Streptomyces malaysiensis TaxID=92644 RepID=UPI002B2CC8AA|nr:hypothetical protein R8789_01595 [Streptomyces malaysiensis]